MKTYLIMAIKKLLKITAVFFIVLSFFGCNKSDDSFVNDNANKKSTGLLEYNSVAELEGKNIGVLTGSVYDDISKELIPNGNFAYFNTASDLISAMDANKIDAFAADDSFIRELLIDSPELGYINECVTETDAAIMFQKTDEGYALMTKFNQFLVKADKDGSLQELKNKWFNYDENTKMPDYENLDNSNGTVNLAVYSENSPYGFVMNGRIVGYDVELIVRFCETYGYGLKVINTNLDGVLSSLQSGKADCGAGGINVTEERRQSVDFSLPTSKIKGFFVVRNTASSNLTYEHISDLNGKHIGIRTGTLYDALTKERLPDSQFEYFGAVSDLTAALRSGKIDAYAIDYNLVVEVIRDNPDIGYIPEVFIRQYPAFVFGKHEKGEKLTEQMNEFLREIQESGLKDELYNKWFKYDENTKMFDYTKLEGTNGTLRLACTGMNKPFAFARENIIIGYEAELAALFCEKYGYKLEFEVINLDGIMAAIEGGRADLACGAIAITDERKQSANFSDPVCENNSYFLVKKTTKKAGSFFADLKEDFYSTFIVENRWMMFVSGAGVTMALTVLTIILGTLLGFITYKKARANDESHLLNRFVNFVIWLIHGLPMVVLLMILYYIVFGSLSISGFFVAVIGFSLSFACSMYSMLKAGEKAVDKGQSEAAFTLGYTRDQAFYKIILPQSAYHFMPSYKGEIVSLIKATAVVGYIAVQDITKIGDIVRSRTYEAFFPLIVIAIMYFVMAAILTSIVNNIDLFIDPNKKDRRKVVKGVETE